MIGASAGSVTWRNCAHAPAPSIRAASYNSSGIDWSPASRMIMLYPKFFHTAKITIAGIAQAGSPSQSIGALTTRTGPQDRTRGVEGKGVAVGVDTGGRRILKQKKKKERT